MRSALKRILGARGVALARRIVGRPSVAANAPAALPYELPEFVRQIVSTVETDPAITGRSAAMAGLRKLGLDDFGALLLSMPNPQFPRLSALLPAMASEEVQNNWTGASGITLLKQTVNFVRSLACNYTSITGRPLSGANILDFGCGYGRIARLMYYFVDEQNFFGTDPWDKSIELCHGAGLTSNFLISDYLPTDLPVGETRFDLIYAFSVFTHLSERAALAAMKTLRKYVRDDGLAVVTIRPVEYWLHDKHASEPDRRRLQMLHRQTGFAFLPHNRPAVDGDITYGDTSMTLEWLSAHCPEWVVQAIDRSLDDPAQIYVFLRPV